MNKIVEIALNEVGEKENPANSNKTKYGVWFGWDGVMWCAIFVSWVYAHSGYQFKKMGWTKGFAGCLPAVKLFRERGEITTDPQPGDVVFFDWNGDGRHDHVGIFQYWLNEKKTKFKTIEGNTSLSNQSNGGEVMERVRVNKGVLFVHPKMLDV